jgi:hypothetical protein
MALKLFDLSDEIQLLDRAEDDWGVEPEQFFYCIRCCSVLAAICSVFEAERTPRGCVVTAYGKLCAHDIEISQDRVFLGSRTIDDKNTGAPERFFAGPASSPESWMGAIRHVFKTERAILQLFPDWTGRMRSEWNEYLRVRRERLGF